MARAPKAGLPSRALRAPLITNISWSVVLSPFWILRTKHQRSVREVWTGLNNVLSDFTKVEVGRSASQILSGITVLSAPVSISKRTCELTINRSTDYKVLFVSLLISPRDKFPSSCNSPTVLEDLQTVPEWPLFEHLKQVAFFAGKFPRVWVGEFPQCSQRVDEGWLGHFFGGDFLSLSFGAFFAFTLTASTLFFWVFNIFEVVSQKSLSFLHSFALSHLINPLFGVKLKFLRQLLVLQAYHNQFSDHRVL